MAAARWLPIAFVCACCAFAAGIWLGDRYGTSGVQSEQLRPDIPAQRLATFRVDGREWICVFDPDRYVHAPTVWFDDQIEAIDCRWYGRPRLQPWWSTR